MYQTQSVKFGFIKGVLIPNITMMFGVILFLRLGLLTAHAGITQMLFVIALSLIIMITTSFSIGALATNMNVGSGGIYYIISRTLGVEIGGAVGLAIYFAQIISITLTIAGFSISVCDLFPHLSLHIVELTALTLLALISGISASWSLRLQGVILILLLSAIGSILLGSADNVHIPPADTPSFYTGGKLSFWQTFALFYPAMTGIEAGMALSGNLRNPGKSLYRGNLYSLIFTATCYAGLAIFATWNIPREVLATNPLAFVDFARWPNLVHVGIWGATLSSALGCLLGAPRMLQSMADDEIVFAQLGTVYGKHKTPLLALGATYVLVAVPLFLTTIDQIIPMLTIICLVSYGLLNLVTVFTELMSAPSWRPHIRTHWLVGVSGVLLIIIAMMMTSPGWALITFVILVTAQIALKTRNLETSFQDLRESLIFFVSRLTLYRLEEPTQHALTWHPQILALVSAPSQQLNLAYLAHSLTRRSGILSFVTVIPEEWQIQERIDTIRESIKTFFEKKKISGLVEVYPAPTTLQGYSQLIKAYGIGPIQPNTVLLEINEEGINAEFVDVIETCTYMQKNLVLLCNMKDNKQQLFKRRNIKRKRRIDICWDPDETSNFNLTVSLVTTLTDGFKFRNSKLIIRAQVSDLNAETHVKEYLDTYCRQNRLVAKTIITSGDKTSSQTGQIGFISLNPLEPNPTDEQKNDYVEYLKQLYQEHMNNWQVAVFVTSYDSVDHRAIYTHD